MIRTEQIEAVQDLADNLNYESPDAAATGTILDLLVAIALQTNRNAESLAELRDTLRLPEPSRFIYTETDSLPAILRKQAQ